MVYHITRITAPPTQSMSDVSTNHMLITRGGKWFRVILVPCYHGSVICNIFLGFWTEPRRSVGHQGPQGPRDPTQLVLDILGHPTATRLRRSCQIHRDSYRPRVGGHRTRYSIWLPWYSVTSAQSQKTSSKRCAASRPISPPLRVHQSARQQATRTTSGTLM